jgi:hypothetical protein
LEKLALFGRFLTKSAVSITPINYLSLLNIGLKLLSNITALGVMRAAASHVNLLDTALSQIIFVRMHDTQIWY